MAERTTVSFAEGEIAALRAILADPAARAILEARLARLRNHVPAAGGHFGVEPLELGSTSDAVRALLRVGLDVVDSDYMAMVYAANASLVAEFISSQGMEEMLNSSHKSVQIAAEAAPAQA
jgi:hypothetical protein